MTVDCNRYEIITKQIEEKIKEYGIHCSFYYDYAEEISLTTNTTEDTELVYEILADLNIDILEEFEGHNGEGIQGHVIVLDIELEMC